MSSRTSAARAAFPDQQVTVESLILAVAGSALGLGVAVIVTRVLPPEFAATRPRTAVG